MPRLTYQPEGTEAQVLDFSFGRLMSPERIVIERLTGLGWDQVKQRFWVNDTAVIHALLFVLLKRSRPTLTAEQLEFCDDDFEIDLSDDEARQAMERMAAQEADLDDDQLEALSELRRRFAEDEAPKAEPDPED